MKTTKMTKVLPPLSAEDQAFFDKLDAQHNKILLGSLPEEGFTYGSAHCLFKNNWYVVRKNVIGTFLRKDKEEKHTYGLPVGPEPSFEFALPKIPAYILKWQVSFYRQVMKDLSNSEAYCTIMWDPETKEYFIFVPKQDVSGASVDWKPIERSQAHPTCIPVVCCHSHNTMSAYFSSTDDKDEKDDMLYMVMGNLDKNPAKYSLRASAYGSECLKLPVEDVFEFSEEFPTWDSIFQNEDYEVPEDWMNKVSRKVYATGNFTGTGYAGYASWSATASNPTFKKWQGTGVQAEIPFSNESEYDSTYSSFYKNLDGKNFAYGFEEISPLHDFLIDFTRGLNRGMEPAQVAKNIDRLVHECLDDDTIRSHFLEAIAVNLMAENATYSEFVPEMQDYALDFDQIFNQVVTDSLQERLPLEAEELEAQYMERFSW